MSFDRWLETVKPREIPILERIDSYMERRDLDSLWRIDGSAQQYPLSKQEIKRMLRKQAQITAARLHGQLVGMIVWEEVPGFLNLIRFGVLPEYRRDGIGSLLVNDICRRRMNPRRKTAICTFAHIRSYDGAALMLKRCGFVGELARVGVTASTDFLTFTKAFQKGL